MLFKQLARLTNAPISLAEEQVQAELVHNLYQQSSRMLYANYPAIALTGILVWKHISPVTILVWVIVSFILTTLRVSLDWRYLHNRPTGRKAIRAGWIFTGFSFLSGCMWGSIGVLFFAPHDMMVTAFICIMVASIIGGSVTLLSAFPPAYYLSAIPTILPFAVRALWYGGHLFTILGVLALICLWVNLVSCRSVYGTLHESVVLRFKNMELIEQLTQQKERSESASQAKSQFLAAASHDLRQPIHALGLFVATLQALTRRPELNPAEVKNIASRLEMALKSLGQLLNGLLDVSRLDAGTVQITKRSVKLYDVLTNLQQEFSVLASNKDITLIVVPTRLWVETDPVVLQSVLLNLVSNAVRYTERGRILIGCRRRAKQVSIQVIDTGIGIAADQLPKIFQEFYQIQNVARDREQGLGLGLSIVKRSVDLLGSQLTVESIPGKGSLFSFTLPITAAVLAAPVHARMAPASFENRALTILAIDDDRAVLDALHLLFSAWGHTLIPALTLEQALAAASAHNATIGFILADYRLAEHVTGATAISAVLALLGRQVPAVIVTGDTSPERIREANATGFRLLHKPLDPQQLHLLVHESA